MSRRKISMFTIPLCGTVRSCVQRMNGGLSASFMNSACATRSGCTTRKAAFSVGGTIKCARLKKVADQFPEIPRAEFERAMTFIEPDGKTFFAAEAVYRSLQYRSSRKWLAWSYDHVPGFAEVSELAYRFIARHRKVGSAITRLLWG